MVNIFMSLEDGPKHKGTQLVMSLHYQCLSQMRCEILMEAELLRVLGKNHVCSISSVVCKFWSPPETDTWLQ